MTMTHTLDVFHDHAPYDGRELIVDNFAGGGGASEGIKRALGREPDIAINHDAEALAMHEMNHPETRHISKNIWQVDPLDAIEGKPVGLAWFSPDCKHFSKAKGGKPVKREIRDLAWVVVKWAQRAKPRVIILENVEEFVTWGPLKDGLPDPERKGETFALWLKQLRKCGYKVQFKELRACDYGAPTVRKRFFLIARRDGRPIVWPKPTHGAPNDPDVIKGKKKPWRTAAEIIDWSLRCPSIFMKREEARAYYKRTGVRVNRPLASATMARVARGVFRFVLDNAKPFIVPVTHAGDLRVNSIDEPVRTQTTANRGEHALITPYLVPRYGERDGQEPRSRSVDEPFPTVVGTGNEASLVAAHVMKMNLGATGHEMTEPLATVTSHSSPTGRHGGAAPQALVATYLAQHNTGEEGHPATRPVSTIVNKGCTQAVVAASLLNMRGEDRGGADVEAPAPTVTSGGQHLAEVRAFLSKYYGTAVGQDAGEPLHTETTKPRFGLVEVISRAPPFGPEHYAKARAVAEFMRAHGLWDGGEFVTIEVEGVTLVVVDIGMRMLTPRERFRAQGFGDTYIIDRQPDGTPITATKQGSCAGNSVSPHMADALVSANCPDLEVDERIAA